MSVRTASQRRIAAFGAVLALLLAQAIGLAHAVAHPQAAGLERTVAAAHDDHDHRADGWFDAQHDEGSLQCQLFDQLTHADGLSAPTAVSSFDAPAQHVAAPPATPQRTARARGYHARGPPSSILA